MCRFSHTEGKRGFERERKEVMLWRERENEDNGKPGINKVYSAGPSDVA